MKPAAIRRAYLREAFVAIALARLVVRFVPPARIFTWANRPPHRINRFAVDETRWISWAVNHWATRPWLNALCLPRALAVHAMLRRRGGQGGFHGGDRITVRRLLAQFGKTSERVRIAG